MGDNSNDARQGFRTLNSIIFHRESLSTERTGKGLQSFKHFFKQQKALKLVSRRGSTNVPPSIHVPYMHTKLMRPRIALSIATLAQTDGSCCWLVLPIRYWLALFELTNKNRNSSIILQIIVF